MNVNLIAVQKFTLQIPLPRLDIQLKCIKFHQNFNNFFLTLELISGTNVNMNYLKDKCIYLLATII